MRCVNGSEIGLDDPVEKFLPEFQGADIKTPATIHHLFTHTADMEGHFTDFQSDLEHVYGEAYRYLVITMTRATAGRNFKKYHPRFITAVTDGIQR